MANVKDKVKKKNLSNPVYQKIKSRAIKYIESIPERLEQKRIFQIGLTQAGRLVCILSPTPKVASEVAKDKSRFYAQLLREEDGLMVEEEILNIMIQRGAWNQEKEKRIEQLRERANRISNTLFTHAETTMTSDEFDKYCEDYSQCEREFEDLITKRSSLTEQSIENRVNEFTIKDQLWRCMFEVESYVDEKENVLKPKLDENGKEKLKPIWNSLDEVDNEKDRIFLARCLNEFITFVNAVPSNFLEDSVESQNGDEDTQ